MLYDWVKAFHVIAIISWMAGMLYLPRLFVYHATAQKGSELSETLKLMEKRLLRYIINPAMALSLLLGGYMLYLNPGVLDMRFMRTKLLLVLLMIGVHGYLAKCRKNFLMDQNHHSAKFYRVLNEIPTVLMMGIIILVIVKPWM